MIVFVLRSGDSNDIRDFPSAAHTPRGRVGCPKDITLSEDLGRSIGACQKLARRVALGAPNDNPHSFTEESRWPSRRFRCRWTYPGSALPSATT